MWYNETKKVMAMWKWFREWLTYYEVVEWFESEEGKNIINAAETFLEEVYQNIRSNSEANQYQRYHCDFEHYRFQWSGGRDETQVHFKIINLNEPLASHFLWLCYHRNKECFLHEDGDIMVRKKNNVLSLKFEEVDALNPLYKAIKRTVNALVIAKKESVEITLSKKKKDVVK